MMGAQRSFARSLCIDLFRRPVTDRKAPACEEARAVIDAIPASDELRSETPLGLPSTIADALSGIPGEAGGRLGDPDAAVQQKVEFRSQQIALRRGEILHGAGAHQAVDAVDVALHCALSVVGPLPQDRLEAAGQHTTGLHQDVQVLLSVSGYFLGSLDLPGEHLVELFGGSLRHLLAGISGIAGRDPTKRSRSRVPLSGLWPRRRCG